VFDFARQNAFLIPALPLAACVFIGIFGRWLKGAAHYPAWLALAGSLILSLSLLFGLNANPAQTIDGHAFTHWITWFSGGDFSIDLDIRVDQLTAIYLTFVTGIGLLIFLYAAAYMKGDYGYWRFFAYMSIFVFFMTTLVMAGNFVLLYLGWEGVGLASYLLIGYYYPRPSAVAAAKKAFITNRVGDFGLAIGIFLLYLHFGNVSFSSVLNPATAKATFDAHPILYWVPFCLMLGAFGKSAQFPLHVWLPDAMEGPTPVSALIHAATMVTAGVYLIARAMPLFLVDPNHTALHVVACVGGFTAFLAASIAMCTYDLKRVWAYSTLSQLGYMFLGLGVLAGTSAVFHVFTHAFFKALLFLSAGSVMHAMGGELDMRKMSGIRKVMPITAFTMLIGCLALAGFPGLAGFFSKDEIISAAFSSTQGPGFLLGILALVVALMTAYYTFRLYFKVFTGPLELPPTAGQHEPSPFALHDAHGSDHGRADHDASKPTDGSPLLWIPLLVLCIGAIGAGYLGFCGGWERHDDLLVQQEGGWFHQFVGQVTDPHIVFARQYEAQHPGTTVNIEYPEPRFSHAFMMALSGIISIVGIAIAFYFYKVNRAASAALAQRFRPLVTFLSNKWYWDEIYALFLLKPLRLLAYILSGIDQYFIDGLVWLVGVIPQAAGYSLKPTQRGFLPRYAVSMIAGLVAIILCVLYLLHQTGS
jgi:NADH-quinone oxidoreductase subunit L